MEEQSTVRMSVDSGLVVVIFVCLMYIMLVFGLLFYVENDWCDLLFENMTVRKKQNKIKEFTFRIFRKMLLVGPAAIIRLGPWSGRTRLGIVK